MATSTFVYAIENRTLVHNGLLRKKSKAIKLVTGIFNLGGKFEDFDQFSQDVSWGLLRTTGFGCVTGVGYNRSTGHLSCKREGPP